jgi:hypothetical protein
MSGRRLNTAWLCTGGTDVRTHAGSVRVEHLAPGAAIRTWGGGSAAVEWIGRLHLSVQALAMQPERWPVRIAAGALADDWPASDMLALPDLVLEVPGFAPTAAKWLVNGSGLTRQAPVAPLDIHTLFLDGDGPPDGMCMAADATPAPRPDDAALFALRRHLAIRAGEGSGTLRGSLDAVGAREVAGWIADGDAPGRPVAIEVIVDGHACPPVVADRLRADLAEAGIGDGHRAFRVTFAPPLSRTRHHLIRVRRAVDGADLPGSPALLDGAPRRLPALLEQLDDAAVLRPAAEAAVRALAARLGGAAR